MRKNSPSLLDILRREEHDILGQLATFRHFRQRRTGIADLPERRWGDVFDAALKNSLEQHQDALLWRLAQKSRALAEARDRLQGGGYGICAECGRQIPPRRLKALPTATLCVACQERREAALAN
jgi:phage/conjugal plasmid C-4 type zinc finger TraR family protein